MNPIIKIENLSKLYRLGTIGTGTLSRDLNRWWARARGKEDPYQKIGEVNDRATKGGSEFVWALKDINLEVMPGEVLGIIGKNGAGKSTLLKILSKVTGPTTGRIMYNGRIGSLLEVGTGFHSELTGRENIYLNGAILGMTRAEVKSKLDEIIDFSGCERYIDTPVKRYSSGMTVRLGFAVAAHLEPEILVVDEVLAVGDAEFQKKAVGKMQQVSRDEGRTVLFVSHNMAAVSRLCHRSLLLGNGKIQFDGDTNSCIKMYLSDFNAGETRFNEINNEIQEKHDIDLISISTSDSSGSIKKIFQYHERLNINLKVKKNINTILDKILIAIHIFNDKGNEVLLFTNKDDDFAIDLNTSVNDINLEIEDNYLGTGQYYISIWIGDEYGEGLYKASNIHMFEIINPMHSSHYKANGLIKLPSNWKQFSND